MNVQVTYHLTKGHCWWLLLFFLFLLSAFYFDAATKEKLRASFNCLFVCFVCFSKALTPPPDFGYLTVVIKKHLLCINSTLTYDYVT